jgi:hypothetical protein
MAQQEAIDLREPPATPSEIFCASPLLQETRLLNTGSAANIPRSALRRAALALGWIRHQIIDAATMPATMPK